MGRLTLEYWLTPRLAWDRIHRWPGTEVVEVTPVGDDELRVLLSDGTGLAVDRVVFGSGYRAELTKVPYLAGVLKHVKVSSSFPVLDEAFQTSLDGLYVTGFSATQDFGPFFGFVKGSPAAATLIVRDLLSRRRHPSRPGPSAAGRGLVRGVFAPGHLGELIQIVPFEMVDGAPRGAVVPDGGERPSISPPS